MREIYNIVPASRWELKTLLCTMKNKSQIKKEIQQYFEKNASVVAVYLFGSCARTDSRQCNDVDIAVLYKRDYLPDTNSYMVIKHELSDKVDGDVDLVILNTVSPIMQFQVLKKGLLIISNNKKALNLFIVSTLNFYCDLKIVRRPIENSLHRVSFHGR